MLLKKFIKIKKIIPRKRIRKRRKEIKKQLSADKRFINNKLRDKGNKTIILINKKDKDNPIKTFICQDSEIEKSFACLDCVESADLSEDFNFLNMQTVNMNEEIK